MPTDANGNELMEIEEIAVSDGGAARFAQKNTTNGEEKYNIMWTEQSKLLRFDEGENAWKERGQGSAKIMQRKDDVHKYLFIFRRDGIGKLSAQHYLVKGTRVGLHPKSEKAVMWTAAKDFTDDEEGFPESFVLRLPTKESAAKALAEMQKAIDDSNV